MSTSNRFVEGWIHDRETGLEWSRPCPEQLNRLGALAWCEGQGGRLPTIQELASIVNYGRTYPATDLPFGHSFGYVWSDTPLDGAASPQFWVLELSYGCTAWQHEDKTGIAIAVRDLSLYLTP